MKTWVAVVVVVLLAAGGWGATPAVGRVDPQPGRDRRPNLVLITIDSLRYDHLGVYGYSRPTSPNIDAFAREAVVVSDAITQAPYTKAAVASMFTGLFPTAHKTYTTSVPLGILQRSGSVGSAVVEQTDVLSPALPALPASLQAAGYHTIAFSANPFLIADFGYAHGFDRFTYVKGHDGIYAHADEMMALAAEAVAQAPRPFFLWVHLMDTHNPYTPPQQYQSMLPPLTPAHPIDPARIPDFLRIGNSNDLNLYVARYDAGARAADAAIGRFFSALRAGHLWDQTGVVITADHGEGFMEHNLMSHNNSLYDELLHIPLIIKLPGLTPRNVRAQVQLADLFPTLAHVAGAAVPKTLHASDMMPVLAGTGSGEPYAYAELVGVRFALRSLDWKIVASFQGGRELFNLKRDHGEAANLARTDVAETEKLERVLARALAMAMKDGEGTPHSQVPVSPLVLQRLRALGYITK